MFNFFKKEAAKNNELTSEEVLDGFRVLKDRTKDRLKKADATLNVVVDIDLGSIFVIVRKDGWCVGCYGIAIKNIRKPLSFNTFIENTIKCINCELLLTKEDIDNFFEA